MYKRQIVYTPVPCEDVCPVKAISKDAEGVEHIDKEKCIYCGKCMQACPYGAIMERSKIIDIHKSISNCLLYTSRRTVVSLECRGQIDMPEIGNGTFGVCGPVLLNIVSFDGQRSLAEFGRTIDAASFTGQQFQKNRIFFPARIQVLDDIFDITQIGESHFYNLFARCV